MYVGSRIKEKTRKTRTLSISILYLDTDTGVFRYSKGRGEARPIKFAKISYFVTLYIYFSVCSWRRGGGDKI